MLWVSPSRRDRRNPSSLRKWERALQAADEPKRKRIKVLFSLGKALYPLAPNGRAYNWMTHLDERRKMMTAWANYPDSIKAAST